MSKPTKLPSGRWRIRFFDADGKRQSDTFATFDLARSELRRREVAAEETAARRERYGSEEMTVREAFPSFMARRRPDPNNTMRRFEERGRAHRRAFEHHIEPHLGDVKLCDLTPRVLREWIDKLATTKTARPGEKNEKGRTLSAATIRKVVVTLRQIAKSNDVPLTVTLAESLRQKRRKSRPRALQSIDEVRALLAACSQEWFRVACALACHAGLRLGEVASLRWRHISESDGVITVELSWEGPLKARYEDDEDGARVVPLSAELAAILRSWRAKHGGGPDDQVVLVHGEGKPRPLREHCDDVAAKTRSASKRAGLTPLPFHSLRATYATLVADQGLPVSALSALLGHSHASTTAIYIRPESQRAALDPRAVLGGHVLATTLGGNEQIAN